MPTRRVVIYYRLGILAGLSRIVGLQDMIAGPTGEVPARIDGVDFGDHSGALVLRDIDPRKIVYTEEVPEPPQESQS